jgi:hypothetical protein
VKAYYEDRLRLNSAEHLRSDLGRDHIDYLVAPLSMEPPPYGPDTLAARNEGPLTHRLAGDYGARLIAAGDYGLYRLRK